MPPIVFGDNGPDEGPALWDGPAALCRDRPFQPRMPGSPKAPAAMGARNGCSMIRKAVIPAAGYGTRFLPVTKSVPKEMLPVVDAPPSSMWSKRP